VRVKKSLLMLAAICFLLIGSANAQLTDDAGTAVVGQKFSGILDGLKWKQGFAWSLQESSPNFMSSVEIIKFEKYLTGLTFSGAYIGDGDDSDHKCAIVMEYPIINFKNIGITTPILNLVDAKVGVWYGAGNLQWDIMDTRADYGVSLSLLNFNF
jgi:hypothetical protein